MLIWSINRPPPPGDWGLENEKGFTRCRSKSGFLVVSLSKWKWDPLICIQKELNWNKPRHLIDRRARQHTWKLLNEALDTRIANNLCEYWLQMNETAFLVLDACSLKNFQIEMPHMDFVLIGISFLNISASYMQVPYKKSLYL